MAHKTWLAGLGAYDSGREKAATTLDQLFVDGSALVNDLLEKGESIEKQIQVKLEARNMFQGKISALSALKAKLGFGNESRDQQIDTLAQRVDSLIEVVAKLSQKNIVEKKPTTTKTIKKVSAKPVAAKPVVAKPVVAKPVTAKPATAKPATAKPVAAKPVAVKSVGAKPVAAKPVVAKSVAAKPIADKKD